MNSTNHHLQHPKLRILLQHLTSHAAYDWSGAPKRSAAKRPCSIYNAIFQSRCSIGIGFWRLMRTSTFGIEWGVMRSFVLKQGSVLLAGFDGCSWGIAFCWKYVGSSVGYLYALRCWCGCWRLSADTRYVHLAWGRFPSVAVVIVSCRPYSMRRDAGYLVLECDWVLRTS